MTLHRMSDYIELACFYLRCRACGEEFESFDRDDPCRGCGSPTEVYGLQHRLLKETPQTA